MKIWFLYDNIKKFVKIGSKYSTMSNKVLSLCLSILAYNMNIIKTVLRHSFRNILLRVKKGWSIKTVIDKNDCCSGERYGQLAYCFSFDFSLNLYLQFAFCKKFKTFNEINYLDISLCQDQSYWKAIRNIKKLYAPEHVTSFFDAKIDIDYM